MIVTSAKGTPLPIYEHEDDYQAGIDVLRMGHNILCENTKIHLIYTSEESWTPDEQVSEELPIGKVTVWF